MVYINYLSIYNTEFERHRIETIRSISECCSPCRVTARRYKLQNLIQNLVDYSGPHSNNSDWLLWI